MDILKGNHTHNSKQHFFSELTLDWNLENVELPINFLQLNTSFVIDMSVRVKSESKLFREWKLTLMVSLWSLCSHRNLSHD